MTAYGTLNASEDFAETYACYVRDEDALKNLPDKLAFMRDFVFSGKPETMKEKNTDSSDSSTDSGEPNTDASESNADTSESKTDSGEPDKERFGRVLFSA